MKVFVDTNILLDVLLEQLPHALTSGVFWTLCEERSVDAHISVISFNNVYYLVRKAKGRAVAQRAMELVRDLFQPVALDGTLLNQAIAAKMTDFEDAIQYYSAVRCGAERIVTRNVGHFPKAGLRAITPEEFLAGRK